MLQVTVDYIYPPIPLRNFDWCAYDENYEPGCPIGYGRTLREALEDYEEMYELKYDETPTYQWK